MNVLLTSVGRRGYLVEYFQQALKGRGKVIATNSSQETAGMQTADQGILVKPSHESGYVEQLLKVCEDHDISLLCSLHDLDGYILSRHKQRFVNIGVKPMIPDSEWADICLDKWKTSKLLESHGIATPPQCNQLNEAIYLIEQKLLQFPLILKARCGFGSLGLAICHNIQELLSFHARESSAIERSPLRNFTELNSEELLLIQQYVTGKEHCLSILNNFAGRYYAHFGVQILEMRAGESDRAVTVDPSPFASLASAFAALSQHKGIWELDTIQTDTCTYVLEINPRFTGAYPFYHLAGANIPATLIAWMEGETPNPEWTRPISGISGFKDITPRKFNFQY